jgi:hypothetical protein
MCTCGHHEQQHDCGCEEHEPQHECGCGEHHTRTRHHGCDCGCGCSCCAPHRGHHGRCQCGCGGHHGYAHECCSDSAETFGFQRRFATKEEQAAELEAYLKELRAEAQAVEEHIEELRAGS